MNPVPPDRLNHTTAWRQQRDLHFHRLNNHQHVTLRDTVTQGALYLPQVAGDRTLHGQHALRQHRIIGDLPLRPGCQNALSRWLSRQRRQIDFQVVQRFAFPLQHHPVVAFRVAAQDQRIVGNALPVYACCTPFYSSQGTENHDTV